MSDVAHGPLVNSWEVPPRIRAVRYFDFCVRGRGRFILFGIALVRKLLIFEIFFVRLPLG